MVAIRDLLVESRILLLCTGLALGKDSTTQALTPSEWRMLSSKIEELSLCPWSSLLGLRAKELAQTLGTESEFAERIVTLLGAEAQLDCSLSRLESMGVKVTTTFESDYPKRLAERLGTRAPQVLYVAGEFRQDVGTIVGVAGSRDVNEGGRTFAYRLGRKCAEAQVQVVTGAARGVDQVAMNACLESGGSAIGIVADGIERAIRNPENQAPLEDCRLTLLSPYLPSAQFSIANAMNRNKVIYCLADYSIVVDSALQKGGTWQGAREALRHRWSPVFVRSGESCGAGNDELLSCGGIPLTLEQMTSGHNLEQVLQETAAKHDAPGAFHLHPDSGCPDKDGLLNFLKEARSTDEIAKMLKLTRQKTKQIIAEEIENGRVAVVRKRPLLYQSCVAGGAVIGELFDTGNQSD